MFIQIEGKNPHGLQILVMLDLRNGNHSINQIKNGKYHSKTQDITIISYYDKYRAGQVEIVTDTMEIKIVE